MNSKRRKVNDSGEGNRSEEEGKKTREKHEDGENILLERGNRNKPMNVEAETSKIFDDKNENISSDEEDFYVVIDKPSGNLLDYQTYRIEVYKFE